MGAIGTVSLDYPTAPVVDRRKRKRYAYPAWLCLGSHYLYLGRPFTQLLFWATLGGLLLWWLVDFFRLPAMVWQRNELEREKQIARYEQSLHQRLMQLEALRFSGTSQAPLPAAAADPAFHHHLADLDPSAALPGKKKVVPALALTGALAVSIALYVFNPPPLFPHADASFRAMRQVNVRDLPSTASPIRAVVAKETVLSGTLEAAASGGTAKWLKIGRGSHSGGYVATQNLETL